MNSKITTEQWDILVENARAGADLAFLTKPGSTRYGAAVLSSSGSVFKAGQYSSFNHITNIHAEMAAILAAVNANDPSVCALALVCTSFIDELPSPCGVCRQFIYEHAQRSGVDIEICLSSYDGSQRKIYTMHELLPASWSPQRKKKNTFIAWKPLHPANTLPQKPLFGSLLAPSTKELGLLWEPELLPGKALLKMKYFSEDHALHRYPHSFHEYDDYLSVLQNHHLLTPLPWGSHACLVDTSSICGWLPPTPLQHFGLSQVQPLLQLCAEAEIPAQRIHLTASHAAGVNHAHSDLDIIISATPTQIQNFRQLIRQQLLLGHLLPPNTQQSATWTQHKQWAKTTQLDLIESSRSLETWFLPGPPPIKCSIIYVRPHDSGVTLPSSSSWKVVDMVGTVIEASESHYKRAEFQLKEDHTHRILTITCWHKTANILQCGDHIRCRAAICQDHPSHLYQIHPDQESITPCN